jgi:hypothetical protein
MIFEFPFDLIMMMRSNPPIPAHPMISKILCFVAATMLFVWGSDGEVSGG